MCSTAVCREPKERCRAALLSLRCGWYHPRILSKRSIRPVMMGSRVGAGLFERLVLPLRCFTKKPIERLGDWGAGPREWDHGRRVLSIFTLGALSCDNSSPCSSCCHSMTSGALGSAAISFRLLVGKLIFCFLPTLLICQTRGLSVRCRYNTP